MYLQSLITNYCFLQDMLQLKRLDAVKSSQLDTEIKQHKAKMMKINKKLAKDVAKWVDSALSGMNKEGGPSSSAAAVEDDLDITDDLDSDEPVNQKSAL